jgi:serine/threonine-protein kinase
MQAVANAVSRSPVAAAKPSILFVDDEPSILMAVRVVFRSGYNITVTTDGNEAVELLKTKRFDVIVSDQRMPTMTGVQLLTKARSLAPDTVRILLTGYSDQEAVLGAINDVEVHRFLQKPWDNAKLKKTIDEAIELAESIQAAREAAGAEVPTAGQSMYRAASAEVIGQAAPQDNRARTRHGAEPGAEPLSADFAANEAETVLIVDSEPKLFQEARSELAGQVVVVHAGDLRELFSVLGREAVNVIVCGFDPQSDYDRVFLQMLKQQYPSIYVIAMCESIDSARLIELINEAKIYRFIKKPISQGLLSRYILSAIKHVKEVKQNPVLVRRQAVEELPAAIANSPAAKRLKAQFSVVNSAMTQRFAKFVGYLKK